ncbi:bifunctional protein aas : Acylglycerophosphoethanolamine acyltransferase OS=Blastopirellula marina DSM 3645 GN=DSM3645_02118 PE=4 SV=1: Acyltransferase: PP-binding: AMP-binding [Gemmataceae bacterium]|nr:bifunctional protein aas : Acylglycerophosphoethanolamine acyltransferase OS=Blastopirellula marina DSM 3645 GN=DSM3645_02118 PE=4 SV=1: Acyltransferase: PP-binding: AMP-binding [Gemmataceae bacterium]VTU00532.1 bifunctional protein aas : Acylglycerophosphoethanolamine acyltransferase OS=Blastopirellula marina DSM 3645 GN=DSM3645_02118 PE=4 SV=1: Acyltransferase: PP-binding: AMP-binding [Gemmataceae bacterium]
MIVDALMWPVRWVMWATFRVLLAQRYWLTLKGKDEVLKRPGPYLIMPNHPALVEALLLYVRLWSTFRMRPLLLETNFNNPVMGPFGFIMRAIRMPEIARASAREKERAGAAVAEVVAALNRGENVILWPSGKLSRDGSERLGGARTAADVLAAVPGVTVVLVRTRGLWGSRFSFADREPFVLHGLFTGLALWASNLFLFAPRRRVTTTLEAFTPDQRPEPTREAVNKWLEAWYNADVPREAPTFVPHHFLFGPRTHEFPPPPAPKEFDLSKVKPETKEAVAHLVAEKIKRPLADSENRAETTLGQLGMDSLDAMDVTLSVEQRFGFSSDAVPKSLGELWALAEGLQEKAPPRPAPPGWFDPPPAEAKLSVLGETVAEAFLNRAFASPKQVVVADDLAGGVTYEKLVVGAAVMAARFRALPSANVGLMLPAAVACDLAFLGLHLAGKVPVVLNWTTGPANLGHAVRVAGLTHVVTSKAFVDRVQPQVPGAEFLFLEDLRAGVGTLEKLRRLLGVRWFGGIVRNRLLSGLSHDPHAPAVVLFTSGSEKAPKAVPLTHANIIADQRGCIDALNVTRDNSAIGFLPMFHSFGLTVTGLLPLFVGVRIVHHPDPTDAGALVRKIAAYKPTLLAGTPTFLGFILERAKPGDLDSLRIIIVGAEKCPSHVFEKTKQLAPRAEVLEGYGITECAPVVSVNRPGRVRPGTIGEPLPNVQVLVTELETKEPVPQGTMGMLHVAGPTVFPGYLGADAPDPFAEIGGKKWYVTGDLAALDEAGAIVFHGRLKRFLKAGGEMISLPALEEPFAKKYPPTDAGPRVAVEGVETDSGRRIVLFTTEDVSLTDANALLQAEGLRGVMRLDAVTKLDALPVLGTGKTDYKVLRGMIEAE